MIGDRQPVAAGRAQQVLARHPEVAELQAVVVQVLEGVEAVASRAGTDRFRGRAGRRSAPPACSSIRHTSPIVRPGTALVMNSFSPLTTYSSPSSRRVVLQGRQVGAGTGLGERERGKPFAAGQIAADSALSARALPKVRSGSTAPMQPCTDASPATLGSIVAICVRNRENAANGAPHAAVLGVDQEAPVAGLAPDRREPPARSCCRARTACPGAVARDGLERLLHVVRWQRRRPSAAAGRNRSTGSLAIPDRAMGGAVGRLVARGEESVDLVVGSVERAGRPRLFFALAAQLQCGLDERLALGLPNWVSIGKPRRF